MDKREQCLEYLKNEFLTGKLPDAAPENMHVEKRNMKEENWLEIPNWHKEWLVDLVLGFSDGGSKYQEIVAEANKKSHSVVSFTMIVKDIIYRK